MANVTACAVQQPIVSSHAAAAIMFAASSSLATGKRKTPSELRAEQLKRARITQGEGRSDVDRAQVSSSLPRGSYERRPSRLPRFVDTKVPDVYPATKSSDKPKNFVLKKRQKNGEKMQPNIEKDHSSQGISLTNNESMMLQRLPCEGEVAISAQRCGEDVHSNYNEEITKEKLSSTSSSSFKNVTELSSRLESQSGGFIVDMAQAIRTLAAIKLPQLSTTRMCQPCRATSSMKIELEVGGKRISQHSILCYAKDVIPLDLSLKTGARFLSSKNFNWCQKSKTRMQCLALQHLTESQIDAGTLDKSYKSDLSDILFWKSLHTWVYPQSPLSPSVLSALVSQESGPERQFLAQRRHAWGDAFCSLYHMFRNQLCSLFYLCAQSFVVLFVDGDICGRKRGTFSAYMTRSTRGLRRLLQEQDIRFSMPLCKFEPGIATYEELQDLREFERSNPGQTRIVDSMVTIDKSPKSLLAFLDNQNVHRLFNFLLNNRLMLNFTIADLPTLHAPVPFHHASLRVPEVRCKEVQLPSATMQPGFQQSRKNSAYVEPHSETLMQTVYSLEIKDAQLAPWVVSKLCTVLQKSHCANFKASFVTDAFTEELNISQVKLEMDTHLPSISKIALQNQGVDEEDVVHLLNESSLINHIEVIYDS
ncbi:hypothetical protein O6H91_20G050200 [Diphasiastrum complanatum]|uniref:Uncharacterized protein n=1 Tax=Diphasiastrum complanatum TaxID=34168 RepID=A0ACC2AQ96_DIPCM|nr:hypothetical protein O6H91_20G050200 [Diphasiastrum complanatum]